MVSRGARVEIEDLEVGYGRMQVLADLDLDVAPGSFVALLGSSGCGKTTLLRTISGFLTPSRGRIRFDGADVAGLPPERRNTAMVFQSYALWPHMTVAANIGYGLKVRGLAREEIRRKVEAMLALLNLAGFGERKVTDLSGGQRQRVALGRALAVDPPLLLLDEPLSNLDAKIRHAMRHEIRAIQERLGLTVLHVTHDQEEAMVMADRILVMDRGRIVQDGPPEAVYRRPNSPFVAAFLGADNVIEGSVRREGERLRIALPGGGEAAVTSSKAVEGPCIIQFRGSAVRLSAGPGRTDGLELAGRIVQATYPGGRYRYTVETPAGTFMVEDAHAASAGEAVTISVPAEDLHVFARPGAGAGDRM